MKFFRCVLKVFLFIPFIYIFYRFLVDINILTLSLGDVEYLLLVSSVLIILPFSFYLYKKCFYSTNFIFNICVCCLLNFFLFRGITPAWFSPLEQRIDSGIKYLMIFLILVFVFLILPVVRMIFFTPVKRLKNILKAIILILLFLLGFLIHIQLIRYINQTYLLNITSKIDDEALSAIEKNDKDIILTDSFKEILKEDYLNNRNSVSLLLFIVYGDSAGLSEQIDLYITLPTKYILYISPSKNIQQTINLRVKIAELLINKYYGKYYINQTNRSSPQTIVVSEKDFKHMINAAATYDKKTGYIFVNKDTIFNLTVLIHEYLHAYSYKYLRPDIMSYDYKGLEEAITEYLTINLLKKYTYINFRGTYVAQREILKKIIDAVGNENLQNIYFNNQLTELRNQFDSKYYDGAFCTVNYYLDDMIRNGPKRTFIFSISNYHRKQLNKTLQSLESPDYIYLGCNDYN